MLALKCYLPIKSIEEVRQVARSTVQLGTVNVIIFTITFYSARRYFELDKKVIQKRRHLKGITLAVIFGIATVLTMIILPIWLKASLSGSVIAIELTINVIVDVFVLVYEKLVNLLWKPPKDLYKDINRYLKNQFYKFRKKLLVWLEKIETFINQTWDRLLIGIHWHG